MTDEIVNPWIVTIRENKPKLDATLELLAAEGIHPKVFEGYDHRVTGVVTTVQYPKEYATLDPQMVPKQVAMFMSHIVLWKVFKHSTGDDVFTVLEDDVRFEPGWRVIYSQCAKDLPGDWDLFYPGHCCCSAAEKVSGALFKIKYLACTHSYLVRRKALDCLINSCSQFLFPVDIMMGLHAFPKLNVYGIVPRITYQLDTVIPP